MKSSIILSPVRITSRFMLLLAIFFLSLGIRSGGTVYAAQSSNLTGLKSNDINGAATIYGPAQLSTPPANDNFANATEVSDVPYGNIIDTTGASTTGEPGEVGIASSCNSSSSIDDHSLYLGHKTVWYKFNPPASGPVSIDTLGSNYDTYIALWSGSEQSQLTDLTLVACDDDNILGQTSQLLYDVTAGATYYIQVAQYNGYYLNGTRTNPTGGTLNFHISEYLGTGKYDDTNPNWVYTGSWGAYSGGEPYYSNTTHYTLTVGDSASFAFNGTQFILSYAQSPYRGTIGVYVDGLQVGTINANGALQYQKTYTSSVFPSGLHIVEFKFLGGTGPAMDVDAIEIK